MSKVERLIVEMKVDGWSMTEWGLMPSGRVIRDIRLSDEVLVEDASAYTGKEGRRWLRVIGFANGSASAFPIKTQIEMESGVIVEGQFRTSEVLSVRDTVGVKWTTIPSEEIPS